MARSMRIFAIPRAWTEADSPLFAYLRLDPDNHSDGGRRWSPPAISTRCVHTYPSRALPRGTHARTATSRAAQGEGRRVQSARDPAAAERPATIVHSCGGGDGVAMTTTSSVAGPVPSITCCWRPPFTFQGRPLIVETVPSLTMQCRRCRRSTCRNCFSLRDTQVLTHCCCGGLHSPKRE